MTEERCGYGPLVFMHPNLKKLGGAYCFWLVRTWVCGCVCACVTLITCLPHTEMPLNVTRVMALYTFFHYLCLCFSAFCIF